MHLTLDLAHRLSRCFFMKKQIASSDCCGLVTVLVALIWPGGPSVMQQISVLTVTTTRSVWVCVTVSKATGITKIQLSDH